MSNSQDYRRTYILSLFVWSTAIGGVLIAGPKLIELIDKKAEIHHQQLEPSHISPLVQKIKALQADKQLTDAQYQQEIEALQDEIDPPTSSAIAL